MASKFVSKRNLQFLLYEAFDIVELTRHPYFAQHNRKSFDLILDAGIKDAPVGVRGISLFIVPRERPDGNGGLAPNDITVTQIYHKMGYRGTPITELSMGEKNDCRGYLVGTPNNGLAYMFQMMNGSRIGVGAGATAISTAAYYAALGYASQRPQGRFTGEKDLSSPQVPIINHADVKRMLLFQLAFVEGAHCLLMQCCQYADLEKVLTGEAQQRVSLLLDLLTPVAKSYPSETSVISTSMAIQCLGGYGYCDDFPVEQYFRDTRIHPIHEGTTGIQGMDILGRKVRMKNGLAFDLFAQTVKDAIADAQKDARTAPFADTLKRSIEELKQVTDRLRSRAESDGTAAFLADATLYLEYFSLVAIAWQWLRQMTAASRGLLSAPSKADARFYEGKQVTGRYFFHYELPKTKALVTRLLDADHLTMEMDPSLFND